MKLTKEQIDTIAERLFDKVWDYKMNHDLLPPVNRPMWGEVENAQREVFVLIVTNAEEEIDAMRVSFQADAEDGLKFGVRSAKGEAIRGVYNLEAASGVARNRSVTGNLWHVVQGDKIVKSFQFGTEVL